LSAALRDWMSPLVERGEIRATPMLVVNAIVSGPVHAIGRRWLARDVDSTCRTPWTSSPTPRARGCAGRRCGRRSVAQPAPRCGRVSLQLVADDGQVLAEGEATAELLRR